ncbi:MAG: hypothetical protein IIA44_15595, partial [Acidobacteria bacterium]|nr:hypothetical protein [Acidobacteriota bacterium]
MCNYRRRISLSVLCAALLVVAAVRTDAAISEPVRSVDNIPPAPATEIRALNTGESIAVTWTASIDDTQSFTVFGDGYVKRGGVNGYRVYRAIQGADPQLIGTTSPGVVQFLDPETVTGTTYIYSVRPFDNDNETLPDIEPGSADDLARIISLGGAPPDIVVVTTVQAQITFDIDIDVTDTAAVRAAAESAVAELGPITAVLHGAGANVPRLLSSLTEAGFQNTLG